MESRGADVLSGNSRRVFIIRDERRFLKVILFGYK
jgi:hypothetical protein